MHGSAGVEGRGSKNKNKSKIKKIFVFIFNHYSSASEGGPTLNRVYNKPGLTPSMRKVKQAEREKTTLIVDTKFGPII
jgi:hypothetical protein